MNREVHPKSIAAAETWMHKSRHHTPHAFFSSLSKVQYWQLIDIPRPAMAFIRTSAISSYGFYKDICPPQPLH